MRLTYYSGFMAGKKVLIIGAGFSGMSAACYLAKEGWDVQVIEKNSSPGGRAGVLKEKGYTFDMGPSWYWMPDIFEKFFSDFGKRPEDYYQLVRLNPSYRVVFSDAVWDIPADYHQLRQQFNEKESGAGRKLDRFLDEARYKYEQGMNRLVYLPCESIRELADWNLLKGIVKMDVFTSMQKHVRKFFSHPHILRLLEFPVIFLGGHAGQIPALYSLMNYADIKLGTWYPLGGMGKISQAMHSLATSLGVRFHFNEKVKKIHLHSIKGLVKEVETDDKIYPADAVISSADYHHTEQFLLPESCRQYSDRYWEKRVMAPSCLLFYVGVGKKISGWIHHTLFFDEDFDAHINSIYHMPRWPEKPLFYLSAPSVTDTSVSPDGKENLFFLIPVASGMKDISAEEKEQYLKFMCDKVSRISTMNVFHEVEYVKSFSISDFKSTYNAFRGNAYGLANTLLQTAHLRPVMVHKRIKNFFFAGQLTIPGPGVPPAIISGKLAARQILKRIL